MNDALMLFALCAGSTFGEQVARHLGIALSAHEERGFEDGEHKARPLVSVRGRDVFVIDSLYTDDTRSVNDKLCRLLFFICTLRDASAARVNAVVPYLAYARKDHRTKPRDPLMTRYVAMLFEAMGIDRLITLDVHNLAAFQNAFRCTTEHLEANPLFVQQFAHLLGDAEVVVVSPDAGGVKRAEDFRQRLSKATGHAIGTAFAEKHRSGVVSGQALVGDVRGKVAIIIDDLISTGHTLARTAVACREHGASLVYAAATHGLFNKGAETALAEPALAGILVTDTVPPFRVTAGTLRDKLEIIDTSLLFAEAIRRVHCGESIVELLQS